MTLSQALLDILACPVCKGPVRLNDSENGLICGTCRLLYPVQEDIPVMLAQEARLLDGPS